MKETVNKALIQRAEEVSRQADMIMEKTRDWQLIKQYMANRLEEEFLTPQQKEKLKRYQFIYNETVSGKYVDQDIARMVKTQFGVSLSQAYEDVNAAKEVFSSTISINKLFELNLALQLNTKYKAKALEMGDMKSLAAFEKNRVQLLKQLPENEESMGALFEGHNYEMMFDPSLLGVNLKVNMKELLAEINQKRGKKINTDLFEELEHEDIPDDDSN